MFGANLRGLQHIGLPVTDIVRSKAFYERLGFVEAMYRELPRRDGIVKVVMMQLDKLTLELYQLCGAELEEVRQRRSGHIDHVALDVADVDAAFRIVLEEGWSPLESEPVFLPFWENGVRYFNILGPDGERVEFNQRIV
ncbi:MAG: VOC family protein [Chloroflexi bacterium]|nr:VOC family protein [Chloroflexota bacterium]